MYFRQSPVKISAKLKKKETRKLIRKKPHSKTESLDEERLLATSSLNRFDLRKQKTDNYKSPPRKNRPKKSPNNSPTNVEGAIPRIKPISPLLTLKTEGISQKKLSPEKRENSAILMRRYSLHSGEEEEQKYPSLYSAPKVIETSSSGENTPSNDRFLYPKFDSKSAIPKQPNNDSMWEVILMICRKEGILGLYKGITPLLIGNFISYGVYFFWYEAFKRYLKIKTNDILGHSKIALFSGMITTTCTNPFWIINAKMTIQRVIYKFHNLFNFLL